MKKKNIFVAGGILGLTAVLFAYVIVGLLSNNVKAYADQTADTISISAHDSNNNQPIRLSSDANNVPTGNNVTVSVNKNGDNPLLLVNGKQYGVPSGVVSSTKQQPSITVE